MNLPRPVAPIDKLPCVHSLSTGDTPVVLDTNTALDWLLFDDRHASAIAEAIVCGRLRWIAAASMRDEFVHVLSRGLARARGRDTVVLAGRWDCHVHLVSEPAPQPLRCTDADDQRFIDLAVAHRARWLFTRDKALLRLARRAMAQGVQILTPACWRGLGVS